MDKAFLCHHKYFPKVLKLCFFQHWSISLALRKVSYKKVCIRPKKWPPGHEQFFQDSYSETSATSDTFSTFYLSDFSYTEFEKTNKTFQFSKRQTHFFDFAKTRTKFSEVSKTISFPIFRKRREILTRSAKLSNFSKRGTKLSTL